MRSLLAALLLVPAAALADPASVHLGHHDGFGRVVFEFAAPTGFTLSRADGAVVVHFAGAPDVASTAEVTRNVRGVTDGAGLATIAITPGARIRTMQLGSRVVVDVLDPPTRRPPAPAADAVAAVAPASPTPSAPPPAPPPPLPAPVAAPVAAPVPAPVAAAPLAPDAAPNLALAASATPGAGVALPFGATAAAAAFRHGDEAWVVFDEQRPIDLAPLADDPAFTGATVQMLPGGTLLRMKLPEGGLRLDHVQAGWRLQPTGAASQPRNPDSLSPNTLSPNALSPNPLSPNPLSPQAEPSRILFPSTEAGQVVTVPDPETGQNLLVGTMRHAAGGVPVSYRSPGFNVRPSWQGVVVEPLSDTTALRAVPDGFALETGMPLSAPPDSAHALEAAGALTRRFDFPTGSAATLLRRLQTLVDTASEAPPQSRLAPREAAAQTMLALGLGPEALSLLQLAVSEDPRGADDPDIQGLTAIASLLSDHPAEAGGLAADALTGTDEVALWRAVRDAMLTEGLAGGPAGSAPGAAPGAAPVFAATLGLILAYPDALRDRLLPLAAETMAAGGAPQAADALLAKLPDEPRLAFARAMRLEARGDSAPALAAYDALAASRDRLQSARAATRATMLRLSTGAITPGEAADQLEAQFLNWRGDGRELALRLQAASLRAKAGQWRQAFGLLREARDLLPDAAPQISQRLTQLLDQLVRGPGAQSIPPLDLVALAEDNAEAVAQSDQPGLAALLAQKLIALDLPGRAGPVLQRMIGAAPPGAGRAALGVQLAGLQIAAGDAAAAQATLADTAAPGLPPELAEQRGLVDARISLARHDTAGAAAILAQLGTPAADELRARVLEAAGDWPGAADALGAMVARQVTPDGALDAGQQDLLLRLASAQFRAGNNTALQQLAEADAARMTGPRADTFRLLTAPPVSHVSDIKRAAGELALARTVPSAIAAMGTR